MKTSYRKYQILAIAFALLTITASLFAALTSIQHASLMKAHEKAAMQVPPPKIEVLPDPEVVKELTQTKALLEKTRQLLAAEKENTSKIQERADWLARQLAAEKAKNQEGNHNEAVTNAPQSPAGEAPPTEAPTTKP